MKIEKLRIHKPYRQRDKLLIHLLAIKNPHLPAVTNGYKNLKFVDVGKI